MEYNCTIDKTCIALRVVGAVFVIFLVSFSSILLDSPFKCTVKYVYQDSIFKEFGTFVFFMC
jgi:hypothetical protein